MRTCGPFQHNWCGCNHISELKPPLRSSWNLCIHKDILKGIHFYSGRPSQVKDLTCLWCFPSCGIYCPRQIVKCLMPKLANPLSWSLWMFMVGLSGEACNITWCFTSRALSFHTSFSCSSTHCITWSFICDRAATCSLWASSSLIIHSTFSLSASRTWALSGASPTTTHWHIKLSWCVQAWWRFCSTVISISPKENDHKTSLWSKRLMLSSWMPPWLIMFYLSNQLRTTAKYSPT